MSEITQILSEIRGGNQQGAEQLLSLVYTELKRIAAQKMAGETPGHTLQPTALVHEAWMRLVGDGEGSFENRAHFFSAAAEAMRRILIDSARRRRAIRRGSGAAHEKLEENHLIQDVVSDELLAVDEALDLVSRFAKDALKNGELAGKREQVVEALSYLDATQGELAGRAEIEAALNSANPWLSQAQNSPPLLECAASESAIDWNRGGAILTASHLQGTETPQ